METTIDIRTADGNVNILLEEKQVAALRSVLVELCSATKAIFAMLIDAAGRVVATGGETSSFELEAIAALSAADLATSRQLAGLVNEPEFALLLQHDRQKNLFMTAIETDAVLIVVFDTGTTFGALRLRIRRSVSQLQAILKSAKRSTVVDLSSTPVAAPAGDIEEKVPAAPPPVVPPPTAAVKDVTGTSKIEPGAIKVAPPAAKDVQGTSKAATGAAREVQGASKPAPAPARPIRPAAARPAAEPVPAAAAKPGGLPAPLAEEARKMLEWFASFQGWEAAFSKEAEFLRQSLEKPGGINADLVRAVLLRLRARLKEQKRLLEARFRIVQSLYQQFVLALQVILEGAWHEEVVDRAMKVAFSGVGGKHNLVGGGVHKHDGTWTLDFNSMGKQLISVCHEQGWDYHHGLKEMLVQLNAGMSALSSFVIEDVRLRDELTKSWARLYQHYTEGLKTLELETDVLDLFRPLLHSGQVEGKG